MTRKNKKQHLFLIRILVVLSAIATVLLADAILLGTTHSIAAILLLPFTIVANLYLLQLSVQPIKSKSTKNVVARVPASPARVLPPRVHTAKRVPVKVPVVNYVPASNFTPPYTAA